MAPLNTTPRNSTVASTVWVRSADTSQVGPEFVSLLNAAERERYERVSPIAARRFLTGTVLTRLAVSGLTGVAPHLVPLVRTCTRCGDGVDNHGQPTLINGPWLSLTYSGSRATLALSSRYRVGVDTEQVGRGLDLETLAASALSSAESRWWRGRPRACRERAFLSLWTMKEALAKARGVGLPLPARYLDVLDSSQAPGGTPPGGSQPTAISILTDHHHVTTVAVLGLAQTLDVDPTATLPPAIASFDTIGSASGD
jgi:4'-phosphopantetheinyl transferase